MSTTTLVITTSTGSTIITKGTLCECTTVSIAVKQPTANYRYLLTKVRESIPSLIACPRIYIFSTKYFRELNTTEEVLYAQV